MKIYIKSIALLACFYMLASCGNQEQAQKEEHEHAEGEHAHEGEDEHEEELHLSPAQFDALGMKVGKLPRRALSNVVQANGQLEVPPQNEAAVTAAMGANVVSIEVIEGDEVQQGQVLAYLSHPSITELQRTYLEAYNRAIYLEQEYGRQQQLYAEKVGAGKNLQQVQSEYQIAQANAKSYATQLEQLGMKPEAVAKGKLYSRIPVRSPIEGAITAVEVKLGQYVPPNKDLFEVVNTHHIHVDLMVFEKSVPMVEVGQRVRIRVETLPDQELYAEIYSVGKKFEQGPKAVHVHAELENKSGKLIPGMYVRGEILTDSLLSLAVPESAISREGEGQVIFMAQKEVSEEEGEEWRFTPVRVSVQRNSGQWVGIQLLDEVSEGTVFALNNAYYLMAEMKKGEGGHHH